MYYFAYLHTTITLWAKAGNVWTEVMERRSLSLPGRRSAAVFTFTNLVEKSPRCFCRCHSFHPGALIQSHRYEGVTEQNSPPLSPSFLNGQ